MGPEYSNRFRFPDGRMMNPWWVNSTLTQDEFSACRNIVLSGILGCTEKQLAKRRVETSIVDQLITEGVLQKEKRKEVSKRIVADPIKQDMRNELESYGGFLAANKEDKEFIRLFDKAIELASPSGNMQSGEADEMVYTIVDDELREYIEMLAK